MAAYEYRVSGLCNVPAQQVGELFEQLENSKTGLSPASVVDASRKKGTLLHDMFVWDNKEAAELYRQHQAAALIRNVVVIQKATDVEERESRVRGFHQRSRRQIRIRHAEKRYEQRRVEASPIKPRV